MRKRLALAATLTAVLAAPALTQEARAQTTQPCSAQPYQRQLPAQTAPYTAQPNLFTNQRTPLGTARPATTRSNQIVNINTASERDLDSLPQIGPTRAKTIIGGRPYASTQDLLSKHVVSQRVYDRIKGRITAQ